MTAEIVNESSAKHGILIRERRNLGFFLHLLFEELADQSSEFDSDSDKEFAYFDITFPCDLDDINICVHGRHVLVRMGRMEGIPLGDPRSMRAQSRGSNMPSPTEPQELTIPGGSSSD